MNCSNVGRTPGEPHVLNSSKDKSGERKMPRNSMDWGERGEHTASQPGSHKAVIQASFHRLHVNNFGLHHIRLPKTAICYLRPVVTVRLASLALG